MKQACKAEVAAAASGGEAAVEAWVKCGQAHRAQLQGPVYYTPKKEWLPSACGRNASQVRNDHARFSRHDMSTRSALTPKRRQVPDGQRDAPDGFLADVYGACLPPMDPKAPAATLVATLDGNALLAQPPN